MSDGLYGALRAVQKDAPPLPKDKTNPHFRSKYTSLDCIVETMVPLLDRHGLVWTAMPSGTHDHPTLAYTLAHADTGDAITGEMPLLLDKQNAQGLGSALTYARRYALCSVLNLVADEDDDGTAASRRPQPAPPELVAAGEDSAALGRDIADLLGADREQDKSALTAVWIALRGTHERPTLEIARAIRALLEARGAVTERAVTVTFDATEEPA